MNEEIEKIEIRSEEVQEILGHTPRKIIRMGIGIIFLTLVVLFVGSMFFRYPEILSSRITITTTNPPASIIAKNSGKIQNIFVKDNEIVKAGTVLGILENTTNIDDLNKVKQRLQELKNFVYSFDTSKLVTFENFYELGELQSVYLSFISNLSDYINFLELDYNNSKITSINIQIADQQNYYSRVKQQKNIIQNQLFLSQKQFQRDSLLQIKNVIPDADFEKSSQNYLQMKYSYENAKASLINISMQINQLKQNILDFKLQQAEALKKKQTNLQESYQNLISQIALWENKYLLVSPVDGKIAFTEIWSENQNVVAGDIVFTVIPFEKSEIIGKVTLPIGGSGKVEVGQEVNIKIDNYPHIEYGMLRGKVKKISLVPAESNYILEISLKDSLTTNYGKKLAFVPEMTGTAEVITADKTMFERLFDPLLSVLKK